MKRRLIIASIFVLLVGVGITSFCIGEFNIIKAENAIINSEEVNITPRARILAIIYGNYYNLYTNRLSKGYDGREALNYISIGLGDKMYHNAIELKKEPMNAILTYTRDYDNPFEYRDEIIGVEVDLDKLYEDTAKSLDDKSEINYSIIEAYPEVTRADLEELTALRGKFSTNYRLSSDSRKHNIMTAANYLNGHMIEPDGVMSFNEVVGPRTVQRGFQQANIILHGEMVQGTGGGVCQVSSTTYNACLLAGLNIVHASRHSRVVPYLPASRDAMVSSENDLIIGNPTYSPVYILTKTDGDDITIAVYGKRSDVEFKIRNKIISIIPKKEDKITVEGDNVSPRVRDALLSNDIYRMRNIAYIERVKIEGRDGIISEAYLDKYLKGELIYSQLISHDRYNPQQGEVIRTVI